MAYPFKLLVQSLSVACNLAKVSLDAHELFSRPVLGILDYSLRHAHLARKLECERIAGKSHLQLEHRRDVLHVEHHRSVHHPRVSRCVKLQIGIVRRNDSIHSAVVEFAQDGFRYGSTCSRFRSASELVDEHQGL